MIYKMPRSIKNQVQF